MMDIRALLNAVRANDPSVASLRVPAAVPARSLAAALRENTVVTQLVLSGQQHYGLGDLCELLEALSDSASLRVLDLSNMNLDDEAFYHVADFATASSSLGRLDVSRNQITDETAKVLGQAMRDHATLRSFIADGCELGDSGCFALLEGLGEGCTLHKLNLAHNNMSPAAGEALVKMVRRCPNMVQANLNGNFVPRKAIVELQSVFDANLHRFGFDPSSRPVSKATCRDLSYSVSRAASAAIEDGHRGRPSGPSPAATKANTNFPSLDFVVRCDAAADGLLPNVVMLAAQTP